MPIIIALKSNCSFIWHDKLLRFIGLCVLLPFDEKSEKNIRSPKSTWKSSSFFFDLAAFKLTIYVGTYLNLTTFINSFACLVILCHENSAVILNYDFKILTLDVKFWRHSRCATTMEKAYQIQMWPGVISCNVTGVFLSRRHTLLLKACMTNDHCFRVLYCTLQ